jgi:phenylalanyl-tRNA synthetase beta chain
MSEWSGAKSVSKVADAYPLSQEKISVGTSVDDINGILGSKFSYSDIAETLNNVEFGIEKTEEKIQVTIPYWRGDIHIIEDVAEEVGRLTGFDNIESTLPLREFIATKPTEFDEFKSMLRQLLVRAGASEVLTYSFVHGDVIKKAGLNPSNSYQVINSISPDLQYYRQTLTPSLLDLVHPNVKQSYESFALFEMNKTHAISDGLNDEKVPVESERLALVVVDKYQTGASYYSAKRIFDYICNEIGVTATYEPIENQQDHQVMVPFEFRRSARFVDADLRKCNGVIGEYTRSVAKAFKLPEHTAGFDIDVKGLFAMYKNGGRKYTPISRYPYSERDICFKVNQTTKYSQVIDAAEHALQTVPLESNLVPVDIYQPGDSETKNITIRLRVVSHDHTLTGDEVAEAVETVSRLVIEQTGAEVV